MLCRRFILASYRNSRNVTTTRGKDPDMSKDYLFNERFEVRDKLYLRKITPHIQFIVSRHWKLNKKVGTTLSGSNPHFLIG